MCFNAAKSWQLGWYADKAVTLDKTTNTSYVGVLGGIADYSKSNNTVLVKLNTGSSTDYYVNYNRKSGFNSGTQEGGNRVTVVRAGGEGAGYAPQSELLAKLRKGKTYKIRNFDGTRETATIKVHSIGATARVSICIGPCPVPTVESSPTECSDSSKWKTKVWNRKKKRRQKKGCNWVKNKRGQRCGKVGTGKVVARDACPMACSNCPA
jgi:hypothetical protein